METRTVVLDNEDIEIILDRIIAIGMMLDEEPDKLKGLPPDLYYRMIDADNRAVEIVCMIEPKLGVLHKAEKEKRL